MERLTKRGNDNVVRYKKDGILWELCEIPSFRDVKTIIDRLAYYEDMEEQGRLVVLPCKVGATVYRIWLTEGRLPVITEHYMKDLGMVVRWMHYFGNRVFLTHEEAEKALRCEHEEST